MRTHKRAESRQRGIALAIVVWFIAGMALLVAGIVSQAKTDTRMAQLHVAKAKSTAAADGAINLLMADLLEQRFDPEGQPLIQAEYRVGEMSVSVLAVPSSMLIDMNSATSEVLQKTLIAASAVRPADAQRVASAIVQWRTAPKAAGSAVARFKTLEDVVQVDGLNRSAWDRLRDYAVAVGSGSAAGTGRAAVDSTLAALTTLGPVTRASRQALLASLPDDSSRLQRRKGDYRVDAMLRYGDRTWLRRRWVRTNGGNSGFPWRFLRTEPARIIQPKAGASA
jgi:general secretion pathway protein K